MRTLFLAGTQTDVGKTFVAAALLVALRRAGIPAGYFKPVLTGGAPGDGRSDPDRVAAMVGLEDDPCTLAGVWFAEPASPHFAARLEGRAIDPDWLLAETRRRGLAGPLVVEGCGGLAVPLTEDGYLLSDLAARLGAPVVVVARPRLGAIHETLTTLEHARARRLPVAGIIWNAVEGSAREADTMATVERLARARRLAALPLAEGGTDAARVAEGLDARGLWEDVLGQAA